ncbi:MAG: NAD(P)/FAD-dependent oxidoreductase [Acidobacteriota bacterium]|nr:NAD(P)/FAD-dependent oxidoreductase [Acidobacteriota bacterium]
MDRCDVLIVGGGPAGSSCALGLRAADLEVVVLDRATFPRGKVCAGWITPQILEELRIDAADYAAGGRVIQQIRGFRLSRLGGREVTVDHGETVSYGIRRCEFDEHLLQRSGARLRLGEPVREIRREDARFIVNDEISAPVLVGAGGHFCPVARHLGAQPGREDATVIAREIELAMTAEERRACPVRPEIPELYFTPDLCGYGWVVVKNGWLNVGLGRQDPSSFPAHVEAFIGWLVERGRVPAGVSRGVKGHAYLLYDQAPRPLAGDGVLLVGDAAGLAYNPSGEGIRPAVESGLLAARAIAAAGRASDRMAQDGYATAVRARFGRRYGRMRAGLTSVLPRAWRGPVAGRLMTNRWVARHLVVDRWFLHRHDPPLPAIPPLTGTARVSTPVLAGPAARHSRSM